VLRGRKSGYAPVLMNKGCCGGDLVAHSTPKAGVEWGTQSLGCRCREDEEIRGSAVKRSAVFSFSGAPAKWHTIYTSGDAMPTFEELLEEAKIAHGHLCAGQILGVRLAMLGCARLGIEEPRGRDRKRLVTFVEIDRCATDAIAVVTGCRLGKRALKFRDWGKMAATFVDLESHRAIRIAAKESSKTLARELHPEMENKNLQQMVAYREMSDQDLFDEHWVQVTLDAKEFPGYKGERVACAQCGEGINYDRFLVRDGRTFCLSCAAPEERYYQPL
jgi:formylmethanofuran dehydrogenase subunit E